LDAVNKRTIFLGVFLLDLIQGTRKQQPPSLDLYFKPPSYCSPIKGGRMATAEQTVAPGAAVQDKLPCGLYD